MTREPSELEQAMSRTLRESLFRIQREAEELHQSLSDLVSACASTKPANALSPIMRAQASAASLGATLDVLSRFVGSTLRHEPLREETADSLPERPQQTQAFSAEVSSTQELQRAGERVEDGAYAPAESAAQPAWSAPPAPTAEFVSQAVSDPFAEIPLETVAPFEASEIVVEEPAPVVGNAPAQIADFDQFSQAPEAAAALPEEPRPYAAKGFNILDLPVEEQELHRRANRVAKVSMQDIMLLRPNDVRMGQEQHDLCFRLRDDLERAHREYDRRFQSIQTHPVDYFYDWLVQILANGDPQLLGDYPYPSAVLRH